MTAEEKLKELREIIEKRGDSTGISLTPQDIDLTANLVVERIMALFGREVK